MISALIIIFVLGMMTVFYAENKKTIDRKSKKFKRTLDE